MIKETKLNEIGVFETSRENIKNISRLISSENISYSNLENLRMYDCQDEKCYITTGYIKIKSDNSVYECDTNDCSNYPANYYVECSSLSDVGIAFYDDGFKICTNSGNSSNNEFSLETISSDGKESSYIFSLNEDRSSYYKIYKTDKYANLIGISYSGKFSLIY